MKKIFNIVWYIVFILFVLIFIYYFANCKAFVIVSGSMEPNIKTSSLVIVKKQSSYNVGDIVSYQLNKDSTPVTHRVVSIKDGYFITKGDANNVNDKIKLKNSDILGKVIIKSEKLGKIYINNKEKIFTGIIFIVIIGLGYELVSFICKKRDDKNEK